MGVQSEPLEQRPRKRLIIDVRRRCDVLLAIEVTVAGMYEPDPVAVEIARNARDARRAIEQRRPGAVRTGGEVIRYWSGYRRYKRQQREQQQYRGEPILYRSEPQPAVKVDRRPACRPVQARVRSREQSHTPRATPRTAAARRRAASASSGADSPSDSDGPGDSPGYDVRLSAIIAGSRDPDALTAAIRAKVPQLEDAFEQLRDAFEDLIFDSAGFSAFMAEHYPDWTSAQVDVLWTLLPTTFLEEASIFGSEVQR